MTEHGSTIEAAVPERRQPSRQLSTQTLSTAAVAREVSRTATADAAIDSGTAASISTAVQLSGFRPHFPGSAEIAIAGHRYTKAEGLAGLLGVSKRTLARWDARRIGPPKITIGKTVLYDLAKLPTWLASRESQPVRSRHA